MVPGESSSADLSVVGGPDSDAQAFICGEGTPIPAPVAEPSPAPAGEPTAAPAAEEVEQEPPTPAPVVEEEGGAEEVTGAPTPIAPPLPFVATAAPRPDPFADITSLYSSTATTAAPSATEVDVRATGAPTPFDSPLPSASPVSRSQPDHSTPSPSSTSTTTTTTAPSEDATAADTSGGLATLRLAPHTCRCLHAAVSAIFLVAHFCLPAV